MESLKDITSYILDAAKRAGIEKTECRVDRSVRHELTADAGKMNLLRTTFGSAVFIKGITGGRKGSMSLNKTTKEELDSAIADIAGLIKSADVDPDEDISPLIENKTFKMGLDSADTDKLYDRMNEYLTESQKKYPKVILEQVIGLFGRTEACFANSNGVRFENSVGLYDFSSMFSAHDGDKASSFNYTGVTLDNLDKSLLEIGLFDKLLSESERQLDTISISSKFVGDIILTPHALEDFISSLINNFLGDIVMIQGISMLKDKKGEQVLSPLFTMRSCPLDPRLAAGFRVTHDGYAAENMDIFKNGVLENFTLSRYGAKKSGRERSANYGGAIIVEPGDKPLDALISGVKRGIVLGRFSGGSPGINGDFTGVAKNSFLVEDGEIKGAISETMISGNILDMFKSINGISSESINFGGGIYPYVSVAGVTVSGK